MTAKIRYFPARGPLILGQLGLEHLARAWLILPFSSIFFAFLLSTVFHRDEVFGYFWMCRKVTLPSVSRVLNLPLERILWNIFALASCPLHFFVILRQYTLTASQLPKIPKIQKFLRKVLVCSAIFQSIFLTLLATVGERENGACHVAFFCGFAAATLVNSTVFSILWRWIYGAREDPKYSTRRILILISTMLIIPVIFVSFIAHNNYCIPGAYEIFTIFEYLTICLMLSFQISNLYIFHHSPQNFAICWSYGKLERIRL